MLTLTSRTLDPGASTSSKKPKQDPKQPSVSQLFGSGANIMARSGTAFPRTAGPMDTLRLDNEPVALGDLSPIDSNPTWSPSSEPTLGVNDRSGFILGEHNDDDKPTPEYHPDLVPEDTDESDDEPHEDNDPFVHLEEAEIEAEIAEDAEEPICLRAQWSSLHARNVNRKDARESTPWIDHSTYHQPKNTSLDSVLDFCQSVISPCTQAILGQDELTEDSIMALPVLDPTTGTEESISREWVSIATVSKVKGTAGWKRPTFQVYRGICVPKPHFRLLPSWSHAASGGWLVRLLETVLMIMLDTFSGDMASSAYSQCRRTCDYENSVQSQQQSKLGPERSPANQASTERK
ncbi:hypothetical protein BDV12DRAFT_198291 [Aspergillus spectabilis]